MTMNYMKMIFGSSALLVLSTYSAAQDSVALRAEATSRKLAIPFVLGQGIAGKQFRSAREFVGVARGVTGDRYTAAVLAENSVNTFAIDDFQNEFFFGTNPEDAGANLITGAGTGKIDFDTPGPGGTRVIQVNHFTTDSSEYIPAGVDPDGSMDLLTALRFDVGAFLAVSNSGGPPDPLNTICPSAVNIISAEVALFIDGALVFTAPTNMNDYSINSFGDSATVMNVAGSGVDEIAIVWTIQTASLSVSDNDLDMLEMATLIVGNNGGDRLRDIIIEIENTNGPDNSTITATFTCPNPNPPGGQFAAFDNTVTILTSLADGDYQMRVSVPFDEADLGGSNPLMADLVFFNTVTMGYELAVAGNTQPVGTRFPVSGPVIPALSSGLGDYGVFWDPALLRGFVWANVDHATDFSGGLLACIADLNGDGLVGSADFAQLLGSWGPNPGSAADLDGDGSVGSGDLALLLGSWGACP